MITKFDNFVNESLFNIDREELNKNLQLIGKHYPVKLIDAFRKNIDKIKPFLDKYTKDGQLDLDKLSFLVSINESYYHDSTYWYTKEESDKLYNILKKVFGFPVYLVQLLIEFIKDGFEDGWFMGSMAVVLIAIIMFVISIISVYTVDAIEAHKNGLTAGDVISQVEYHRPYYTTALVGKVPITTHHPARWTFEVRGIDKKGKERIEEWGTTDGYKAEKVNKGLHVNQADFYWEGTVKK